MRLQREAANDRSQSARIMSTMKTWFKESKKDEKSSGRKRKPMIGLGLSAERVQRQKKK